MIELFLIGFLVGLVSGYGMGLFVDKVDKDIKNDRR
jgi:capsular polysaccharide biosynthesis protein